MYRFAILLPKLAPLTNIALSTVSVLLVLVNVKLALAPNTPLLLY